MKNTLDFFKWGFQDKPPEQQIVVCVHNKGRDKQTGKEYTYFTAHNCKNPETASATANRYVAQNKDVYYTLNTYTDNVVPISGSDRVKVSRIAEYARMSRIIGFDVDCGEGKPYARWQEAMDVVLPEMTKLGIDINKELTLICSGGGLHGYIRLDKFILKHQWIRFAEGLKAYFLSSALEIDKGKLSDPAMLLRPCGTYNYKKEQKRAVELLVFGQVDIHTDRLEFLLKDYLAVSQSELNALMTDVGDELPIASMLPDTFNLDFKPHYLNIQNNCNQLSAIAKNINTPEPLWFAAMGVASATDNPREAAIAWSKSDLRYNQEETLEKMAQWIAKTTGPATCATFNKLNPPGCVGCQFAGRVKTPIQTISVPVTVIKGPAGENFFLPPNYKITGNSLIKYNEDLESIISDYPIYLSGVARLYDIRRPLTYLKLKIKIPRVGWQDLEMEYACLTGNKKGSDSFEALMGNSGVILHKKQMMAVHDYIIDAYKHYQQQKDIAKILAQMGWSKEGNFVYGTNELKGTNINPEQITAQGTGMIDFARGMQPSGTKEKWLTALKTLSLPGLELIAFGYLLGYTSLLYTFTDLNGAIINFYSENTGSGKTTACRMAMSIFGHPNSMTGAKNDTDSFVFSKLSTLQNLPYFIDEVSNAAGLKVSDMLYSVSQGADKGRADQKGEAMEVKRWQTLLLTSSNKSLYDKLDSVSESAAGEKARLIEINVSPNPIMKKYGEQLNLEINDNHGHGATDFINYIVDKHKIDKLKSEIRSCPEEFSKHFSFCFHSEERFIRGVICTAWYAAKIAQKLGLCPNSESSNFDLDRIFQEVLTSISRNRHQLFNAVEEASDVLYSYLAKHPDAWVKVIHNAKRKPEGYVPKAQFILGRIEVHYNSTDLETAPTYGRISMTIDGLKKFCRDTNRPYHQYVEKFREFRNFAEGPVILTQGVKYNSMSEPVAPIRLKCLTMDIPINALEHFKSQDLKQGKIEKNEDTSFDIESFKGNAS